VDVISSASISKRFGDLVVLKDFSFHLEQGKCAGVLGVNGSGKTTLLKLLLNLDGFEAGAFTILGREFKAGRKRGKLPDDIAKQVGYVSQQAAFDEEMDGWHNLRFYGRLFHLTDHVLQERIGAVLGLVQLVKFGDMQVANYSGGMKRRLAIARALLVNPSILVLDEPTANLDPISRNQIWDILDTLKKEDGISVLISTNDMTEAQRLCDHVYLLKNGACLVQGSPAALVSSLNASVVELHLSHQGLESKNSIKDAIHAIINEPGSCVEGYMNFKVFIPAGSTADEQLLQYTKSKASWFERIGVRAPTLEDFFLKTAGVSFEYQDTLTYRSITNLFERLLGSP